MHTSVSNRLGTAQRARVRTATLTPGEAALIAILLAGICLAASIALRGPTAAMDSPTITIRVESADTLWGIAQEHTPAGRNTASTVELIRQVNGLSSSALVAGQTLLVPAGEDGSSVAQR